MNVNSDEIWVKVTFLFFLWIVSCFMNVSADEIWVKVIFLFFLMDCFFVVCLFVFLVLEYRILKLLLLFMCSRLYLSKDI